MTSSNRLGEHALMSRSPDGTAAKGASIRQAAPPPGRRRRTARTNSATRPAVPPVMISTATANSGDIGVYVNALGTVTPLNTVSLTARVSGQISKVEYQEGPARSHRRSAGGD